METIILAAGIGSRLSQNPQVPKCLVEVDGRPILQRQIEALREVGVSRFVVVTGFGADQVRAALADLNVTFVHNPRYRENNVLASWVLGSEALLKDHFYLHGDTVFESEVLRRALADEPAGVRLTVDRHRCEEEEMKVQVDGKYVTTITKETSGEEAFGEFTGVALVQKRVLPTLRAVAVEMLDRDEGDTLFFEAALRRFIKEHPHEVMWTDISGLRWREIDFPEDLEAAKRLFAAP